MSQSCVYTIVTNMFATDSALGGGGMRIAPKILASVPAGN